MLPIETFPNPAAGTDYVIEHTVHEFTSVCPKTGHPDFAVIEISYDPNEVCLELKSLKLYLQSFRNRGIFYEDVTNLLLKDLVAACQPHWMEIKTTWGIRGGIHSVVVVRYPNDE